LSGEAKMSFLEHLEELRKRLIICVVSVLAGMIICWFFREQILAFLLDPLYQAWSQVDGLDEPKPLNFSSMLEPFVAYLKLSAIGGLFLAAPVVLFQLWRFVSPGLYPKEKKFAVPFVLVSTLLFVGGSTMAYSMVFPIGFKFFLEFASGQEMTTIESTVNVKGTSAEAPEEAPVPKPAAPDKAPDIAPVDAGMDASVPDDTAEAPTPAPPPAAPSPETPPKEVATWYDALFSLLTTSDCASFEAAQKGTEPVVTLTVTWEQTRCGKAATARLVVRRNNEKIPLLWHPVESPSPAVETLVADDPVPPGAHHYALGFPSNPTAQRLAPVLMIKDYLSFAVRLLLAFGLIFELPIFISFLAIAGIVNYKQLIHFFRYFLVISVLIGAILTPPDAVTQILLATPLMILYTLSIGVAYFFGERPRE
jgi:Tat protein translocase TatC